MKAELYLCCYDVKDDNIRGKVYRTLQQYQSGGQFSAYECYLSVMQKSLLEKELTELIEKTDTIKFQILKNIEGITCLGQAISPANSDFLYIG